MMVAQIFLSALALIWQTGMSAPPCKLERFDDRNNDIRLEFPIDFFARILHDIFNPACNAAAAIRMGSADRHDDSNRFIFGSDSGVSQRELTCRTSEKVLHNPRCRKHCFRKHAVKGAGCASRSARKRLLNWIPAGSMSKAIIRRLSTIWRNVSAAAIVRKCARIPSLPSPSERRVLWQRC